MTEEEKEAAAYIDCMNLRYAIERLGGGQLHLYDPEKIARKGLKASDRLQQVNCYTAVAKHRGNDVKNSRLAFIRAIEELGHRVVRGRFKKKNRIVPVPASLRESLDGRTHIRMAMHEEKETDVNIAIDMIGDAKDGKYTKMILVSGDSDFLPVVRRLLGLGIRVVVLAPPFQRVKEFRALAKQHPSKLSVFQLSEQDIQSCLLDDPENATAKDGSGIFG